MNRTELQTVLLKKATEDSAFRQALVANPRQAIADTFGVKLPGALDLVVFEETCQRLCLVLPENPADHELTDSDLEGVAGGGTRPKRYSPEELKKGSSENHVQE